MPFLHGFDGFRTSHEERKIEMIADEVLLSFARETPDADAPVTS